MCKAKTLFVSVCVCQVTVQCLSAITNMRVCSTTNISNKNNSSHNKNSQKSSVHIQLCLLVSQRTVTTTLLFLSLKILLFPWKKNLHILLIGLSTINSQSTHTKNRKSQLLKPYLYSSSIMYLISSEKFQRRIMLLQHNPECDRQTDKKAVLLQRWLREARYISGSNEPLQRYGQYVWLCTFALKTEAKLSLA